MNLGHLTRVVLVTIGSALAVSCMDTAQTSSLKIINGAEVDQGRYPYAVSLQDNIGHFCGASLIAEDIVLSAAHCAGGNYNAVIGRHDLTNNNNGMSIPVAEEILHPDYNANTTDNDFMVLRLSNMVKGVPLLTVNNPQTLPAVESAVTVMGWGTTEDGDLSDRLLEVEVNTITNQQCNQSSGRIDGQRETYQGQISDNMLCASAPQMDSCQGDSGGPLVIRGTDAQGDVQVGVVSWGIGCAEAAFPGVYARLSSQYAWVKEMVCAKSQNPPASFNCGDRSVNRSLLRKLTTAGQIKSPMSLNQGS